YRDRTTRRRHDCRLNDRRAFVQRSSDVCDGGDEIGKFHASPVGQPSTIRESGNVHAIAIRLNVAANRGNQLTHKADVVGEVVAEVLPIGGANTRVEESVRIDNGTTGLISLGAEACTSFEGWSVVAGPVERDDESADVQLKSDGHMHGDWCRS